MTQHTSAAIFDFDGLIADIEGMFDKIVQMYAEHMIKQKIAEPNFSNMRRSMLGRKKQESEALLYSELGLKVEELPEESKYLIWRQPILQTMFPKAKLLPGAKEVIENLEQNNIPLAIATSSTREDLDLKCTNHPWLLEKFPVIITGDMVENGKPDPELFERAANKLDVSLEESMVFEDATNGVEAALNGNTGSIIAVPDKRANMDDFLALQSKAKPGQVVILKSLEDFSLEAI